MNKMGGIVSIRVEKIKEEKEWEESYYSENEPVEISKRISNTEVRDLSFPLQKRINRREKETISIREQVIPEENENREQSSKEMEIKELEKKLLQSYEKWDEDKRKNHESSMELFSQYNRRVY